MEYPGRMDKYNWINWILVKKLLCNGHLRCDSCVFVENFNAIALRPFASAITNKSYRNLDDLPCSIAEAAELAGALADGAEVASALSSSVTIFRVAKHSVTWILWHAVKFVMAKRISVYVSIAITFPCVVVSVFSVCRVRVGVDEEGWIHTTVCLFPLRT